MTAQVAKRTKTILAYVALFAVLAAASVAFMVWRGGEYVWSFDVGDAVTSADEVRVDIEQDAESLTVADKRLDDTILIITLRAQERGRAIVTASANGDGIRMEVFYVHAFGIITVNSFFGACYGYGVVGWSVIVFLAALLVGIIRKYREDVARGLYRYRNVLDLGLIIYLAFLLLLQLPYSLRNGGLGQTVGSLLASAGIFTYVAFPIAFVVAILVTISNARLMIKEGRTWRNMLGVILGVLVCLLTLVPEALNILFSKPEFAALHNLRSPAVYLDMLVEDGLAFVLAYLECILLGTIIFGIKAARHVPAFDKDAVVILGSWVMPDGTCPPLLRGRADAALAFAEAQSEVAGKDLLFVPSGGKGDDEVCAEGVAIARYLREQGIADERILVEDESTTTEENFRFSMAKIRERLGRENPRIAFATTNYHVFRAGVLATHQGIDAEGVGSKTKRYYWVNAFIREFGALLYVERRVHLTIILALLVIVLAMVGIVAADNLL